MARIINSTFTPKITLIIQTLFENGSISEFKINEGDIVTNLRYIENGKMYSITGKVTKINYTVTNKNRNYTQISSVKSYFDDDVKATSIIVDCSKEYESCIKEIPVKEVVEFENQDDVDRMKYFLKYSVSYEINLTDGNTNKFEITENDEVLQLEYLENGDESFIDGKVIAYIYDKDINPTKLVMISNNRVVQIPIIAVKNVKTVISELTPNQSIDNAISSSDSGIVVLSGRKISEPINISKNIIIKGSLSGVPMNTYAKKPINIDDATTFTSSITIADNVDVEFDGVIFTADALLSMNKSTNITMKNCMVKDLNPTAAKSYVIKTPTSDEAKKVVIKNCYFGDNIIFDGNKYYNTIEMQGKLKDGSEFSNNYFAENCGSNNDINIYDVEENSTIKIYNNEWEHSGNGIRIGIKNSPKCFIEIVDNKYESTLDGEYAGLVIIQPYSTLTPTFANCTITIEGTVHNDENPVWYFYSNPNEMQFTEDKVPTIIENGKIVSQPVLS